ncbi:Bug family tripartite tricarboxylate transporter substrate binding protein [Ramlibacter albus]|uniref:Tripartite tricarboxylate transporter substrate binding protein n=1 Tax=Ramlibacter albus TaxID=2079448 RepID=A0A923S3E6_9BURK|nr:tripartite tricarboxylate transporter substrate binding protein [Ramlibacter albus]MBC5763042.1 tripartite tricarboxylate transporter substrate binding protein [Ramlibacter albus]
MRPFLWLATLACSLSVLGSTAFAQDYPAKTIRLVVPFAPGGAPDIVARGIAQQLGTRLGQSVVVENKLGAGGNIAYEAVAKSPADGYTLIFATTGIATNMSLFKARRYDTLKDFSPVTQVTSGPHVLVANKTVSAKNVRELVAYAKANPSKLSYGSSGNGTILHLAGELFNHKAGVELLHVPYKGASLAQTDLVGGSIQLMFSDVASALPYINAGTLRPLAVTGKRRMPLLPDVPTIAESGVPQYDIEAWFGILAPAGTPQPIVDRLNREIRATLAAPELQQRLDGLGQVVVGSSPKEFSDFLRVEVAKMAEIVKASGIAVE